MGVYAPAVLVTVLLALFGQGVQCEKTLVINTTQLLEQLYYGQIGDGYDIISIEPGSHPNIMSLPKLFANRDYRRITFNDEHDNEVRLSPKLKSLYTEYVTGKDLALGLPDSYDEYSLFYGESVKVTKADFDYIETWRNATSLSISDGPNNNAAVEMSHRVDKLQSKAILKNISFNVQPHSFHLLNVTRYIEHLPKLTMGDFLVSMLSKIQLKNFLRNQELPENWVYVIHENGFVYFKPDPEAPYNSLYKRLYDMLSL